MQPIRFNLKYYLLLLLFALASCLSKRNPTISEEGKIAINEVLKHELDQKKFPFVIATITNADGVIYQQAVGMVNQGEKKMATTDNILAIWSMTKPITSVATMMLIEEGKLKLDDPVSKYLEGYNELNVIGQFNAADTSYSIKPANTITIRHLLNQTTSFAYEFGSPTLNMISIKAKASGDHVALQLPLLHQPGAEVTYGPNTYVLGLIIEKISATTLDEFFTTRIFKPLGMHDTFFKVPDNKLDRTTASYAKTDSVFVEQSRPDTNTEPIVYGDYGLYSTAADYVLFMRMLLNKGTLGNTKILSPQSVELMSQNQVGDLSIKKHISTNPYLNRDFPLRAGKNKFGYGFEITTNIDHDPGLRSAGSYFWSGISNTHFWIDPVKGIAVVYLTQLYPYCEENFMESLTDFEKAVYQNLQ
jgi:CubicO group peptidase (beta-lactamase class C family)